MPKILIVEDDPSINKMYEDVFKLEKYDVAIAMDGQEGLEKAASELPDAILLDIMMPKVDGLLVLERLKKNEKTKHIPVIILSNLVGGTDVQHAKYFGAVKYVVKSQFLPNEIVQITRKVLSGDDGNFLENKPI
ncbi:MAG: response regulator [Candidatus Levyibacteriota bacterium]